MFPFLDKIAAALGSGVGGGLLDGIDKIIKNFKMSPEDLAKWELEKAKLEKDATMSLSELAVRDRESARAREMAIRDWTPSILAWVIVLIFGAAQYWVFTEPIPVGSEQMIARVLGTLDMALGLVLGYYFGSSASSEKKTIALFEKLDK